MANEIPRRTLLTGAALAPLALTLSTPATASAAPNRGEDARQQLHDLEDSYQGRIGAFVLDTGNHATITYRPHERFPLLSTFKTLAAAAVLEKARHSDPGLLDRVIHWDRDDLVEHSPVTEKHVDSGLTVSRLCHAAITRSDNTAGNLLLKQIDGPKGLTRYTRSLGDPASRLARWETELNTWEPGAKRDTTSPASMGRDLAKLAHGKRLHKNDRERLNGWLRANTTGDDRIRAGLPNDWTVGDKTGTAESSYGAANDIAIAWPSEGAPLVFAIYTNRKKQGNAGKDSVIASTAKILAEGLGRI